MLAACTADYSRQLEDLQKQLEEFEQKRKELEDNASALKALVEAAQAADQLLSFEPVAADGEIIAFKAVFKDAGTVTVYNRPSAIGVGQDCGRYYWMLGGEWLRDAAGSRIEIIPGSALPVFKVEDGKLSVSTDGGKSFTAVGSVDKCLVTSVEEDAAQVVFTLSGGAVVALPKYQALTISLTGDKRKIGAGETVEVSYSIGGAQNAEITVLCGSGWSAAVTASTPTSGTIAVTAPSPIAQDEIIVFVSDGCGHMTSLQLALEADESTNPEPPGPPEPPTPEETILRPAKPACDVACDGGEILVDVVANVDYDVTTSAQWLHYTGTKAVRTDRLAFVADANDGDARSATATLASGNYSTSISFLQAGVRRYMNVSESKLSFDEYDNEWVITVSANVDYEASVSADWMELSGQPQQGTSRFTLSIGENDSFDARSGEIVFTSETLGSKTVTVSQAGMTPMLDISAQSMSIAPAGGYSTLTVWSNVDYSVSQPSASWLTVSGSPAPGRQYFTINAEANADYTARSASVTFVGEGVPSQTLTVTQPGRKAVIPRAGSGVNLYTAPSGAHYRYGPSIIVNDDGSIDVWTSKEGGRYLDCTSDYLCQENTTRSKVAASGHTIAQYFNVQHRFMRVMVNLYGTGTTADAVTLRLYKWAGSYAATVAGSPINTLVINNSTELSSSGTRFSIYRNDSHSWLEAGEYLWTATGASSGVGVYKYTGDGSIYVTDSKSYLDGDPVSGYNFQARLRGSAYNSNRYADSFAYYHSSDGGASWTKERDVMFGTEGSEDSWSICDPGVSHFGGWYYIGYTSAKGEPGVFNHCYLARSSTPVGPWYKWNGSGWGGEPAKVIEFTGASSDWGIGEPSIVVKDNTIYLYYTLTENSVTVTKVMTAPLSENWPANLTDRGVALDKSSFYSCDSADVKYVEDYGLFYAFHTYNRMTSASKIAVWISTDGINFIYQGDMTGDFQVGMHNMGVSGDGLSHISLSRPQYVAYAFHGNGNWGNWSTRFAPMYFE